MSAKAALSPRLSLQKGAEAVSFYRDVLGAVVVQNFRTPDGTLVHAGLKIGDSAFSVTAIGAPEEAPTASVLMHLDVDDPDALAQEMVDRGGEIVIPIEDRFYGVREGRVRDPFGVFWILSRPTDEDLDDEEIQKRINALMG